MKIISVVVVGYDRCIIQIKPKNADAWLQSNAKDPAAQYALLDDRALPFYEHKLAD